MSSLRRIVRRIVPMPLRTTVAIARRTFNDWRAPPRFAGPAVGSASLDGLIEAVAVTQPIRHTAHFEGKLHNLTLAARTLDGVRIPKGSTISFWHIIGRPAAHRGYQTGRAIIGDRLSSDVGGGLCQVASLLYELGLRSGMKIVERHPHSRDLYAEDTRFTPLGLDAAIVWGFKDVRWTNTHDAEAILAFRVAGETLHGSLLTAAHIPGYDLEIKRRDEGSIRHVEVARVSGAEATIVSRETYVIDPS